MIDPHPDMPTAVSLFSAHPHSDVIVAHSNPVAANLFPVSGAAARPAAAE